MKTAHWLKLTATAKYQKSWILVKIHKSNFLHVTFKMSFRKSSVSKVCGLEKSRCSGGIFKCSVSIPWRNSYSFVARWRSRSNSVRLISSSLVRTWWFTYSSSLAIFPDWKRQYVVFTKQSDQMTFHLNFQLTVSHTCNTPEYHFLQPSPTLIWILGHSPML
jgi:hypothetical protein